MATRTYVVGGNRGVRRLDDLTGSWQSVNVDVAPVTQALDLYDVMTDPNDPNKVFVVGSRFIDSGLLGLYYSTDGGVNWQQPASGDIISTACSSSVFYEVWVVDSNTIYICGDYGNVLKSTDGGVTFNLTTTCPGTSCNDVRITIAAIHFPNALNGAVCYSNTGSPSIQNISVTSNGGVSWTNYEVTTNFAGTLEGLGIHMSSDFQTITALHRNRIIRSTDGGTTWTQVLGAPWANSFWRHLSWTDDSNLWAYGTLTTRSRSIDGGATWTVLSGETGADPSNNAGHNYSLTDGFFSADSQTFSTANSALTGSLSDITNTDPPVDKQFTTIRAIWTNYNLPTAEPCGCPEGYTYNFVTGLCELEEQTPALCDEVLCNVVLAGCENCVDAVYYDRVGAYFYEDATGRPLPISEDSSGIPPYFYDALLDNSGSILNLDSTVNNGIDPIGTIKNELWGAAEGKNCSGRLATIGVWANANVLPCIANNDPIHQWIGFTVPVNAPIAAVYSIGFAADDRVRITIDGQLFAIIDLTYLAFAAWHVIPITLSAGTHNILVEGYNNSGTASLGAEIYSTTPSILSGLNSTAGLDPYIVWSTADRVGSTFDLAATPDPGGSGESCGGCECPDGYTMAYVNGLLTCVRTDTVAFEPCNCYLATNCEDPEDTQLVSIDSTLDPLDLTLIYVFDFDLTKCWTIQESLDCPFDNPISTVSASYASCEICLGVCYKLTDCESGEIIYVNNVAYAEYVGNTIRVNYEVSQGVFEIRCYTVEEIQCPDVTIPSIGEILDCFDSCEDCIPKPVVPVLDIQNRTVKPGYNTPACTPAYYDKVSCKFAEAMYVKMAAIRYGIEFACDTEENRWTIKYELLKLKSIETEDACTTITNPCCPPCNVVSELVILERIDCKPPTDITTTLTVPSNKQCLEVLIKFPGRKLPATASFTDCNGVVTNLLLEKVDTGTEFFINGVSQGPWPDTPLSYCVDFLQPFTNNGGFSFSIGTACP